MQFYLGPARAPLQRRSQGAGLRSTINPKAIVDGPTLWGPPGWANPPKHEFSRLKVPKIPEIAVLVLTDAILARSRPRERWLTQERRSADADRLVEGLAHDYGVDLIRFISKRVRTLADARDLAQEAFVRLLRMERKELIRHPRAYLYRIAANILYEFELKRKADVAGLARWTEEQRLEADGAWVDGDGEAVALCSRIDVVLEELSPKCRAVLLLHRRDGMTYEEVGEKIGISPSMVKKYLSQGLRHCRERLAEGR